MNTDAHKAAQVELATLQNQFNFGLLTEEEYWFKVIDLAGKQLDRINQENQE